MASEKKKTIPPFPATGQAMERGRDNSQAEDNRQSPPEEPISATYRYAPQGTRPDCVREESAMYETTHRKKPGEYTIADYSAWPGEQRVELIDGIIYVLEAPGFVHQQIAGELLYAMKSFIRKNGGCCIPLSSPIDVRLDCDDKTMVQPDLIILCDKDKVRHWGIMGAHDFVLEILSPATRKKDCTKKLQKYADAGVREYWILDPDKKILLTYDFIHDNMPCIYPLAGTAGLALFDGHLQIDLDAVARLVQDWPE